MDTSKDGAPLGEVIDLDGRKREWAQHFGVGEQFLVDAVQAVGTDAGRVRAFLEDERTRTARASERSAAPDVVDMSKPAVDNPGNREDANLSDPTTVRVF